MNQGIYKIINIITGDYYIGSSLNLHNRYKNHIYKLNKQNHRNNILNRAWKKYGAESFVFVVIKETNLQHEELRALEQKYLDTLKPVYNISKKANCPYMGKDHFDKMKKAVSEKCSKEFIVQNPQGEEYKIKNLTKFCKENNINMKNLFSVITGTKSKTKTGWRARRVNEDYKFVSKKIFVKYKVTTNDNKEIIGTIKEICFKFNLSKTLFYSIVKNKKITKDIQKIIKYTVNNHA
jgi:group I intron endonuclease